MDFNWTPYFTGLWIFPLLCLLFMAIMMLGCRGMSFRCGHDRSKQRSPQDGSPDPGSPN
jgi:hypothetical protein